ncbi:DNA-binding protein [Vibrio sp. HN007]|uniref:helix-turn-helix domain-containing transcriptional regulator n=1 Tax=Vibrio iocasae TaxID=3098914 RepID=UPI0035D4AE9D
MLSIVNVDWESGFILELEFNNGYTCTVDLETLFFQPPFDAVEDFCAFAIVDGLLEWDEAKISAEQLLSLSNSDGRYADEPMINPKNMEEILKQAAWEAIVQNRPDIFQAAIKGFVEELGVQKVQRMTTLKSRPSIYKALNPKTSPKLDTLVQLGHAVFELGSGTQRGRAEIK